MTPDERARDVVDHCNRMRDWGEARDAIAAAIREAVAAALAEMTAERDVARKALAASNPHWLAAQWSDRYHALKRRMAEIIKESPE